MGEQTIITSKKMSFWSIFPIFIGLAVVVSIVTWFVELIYVWEGCMRMGRNYFAQPKFWLLGVLPVLLILGFGLFFYYVLMNMEMTVTNKRVCGKTFFGKVVDLPLDSISAIGTAFFGTITVATSSGIINFSLIKNVSEIQNELRKLIIERQEQKVAYVPQQNSNVASTPEQLKQFKELLDAGVITQEEFDAKKKQILGL